MLSILSLISSNSLAGTLNSIIILLLLTKDVGNVKFRDHLGNEVSSSATIQRGYKADGAPENGFRFNGGSSFYQVNGTYVGGGGAGAYGGNAAASTNSGGGGGSGYTNGSVNVISTSSDNGLYTAFAQIELL